MKKVLWILLINCSLLLSQNKQILYNFAELPQTLLINPGAEVSHDVHVGIPFTSQISFIGGFTGFSAYDLFADDGININQKIQRTIASLDKTEFVSINQQLEIVNVGFRLPNSDFLSFGFYEEFDMLLKIPKDLVDLFYEGNTVLNRAYRINKLSGSGELQGVFHAGLSRKFNDRWIFGVRAKLYSSAFHISTKQNAGNLVTTFGTNNTYKHQLNQVDALVQSSGIMLDENEDFNAKYIQKNMLFGGSLGVGFDFGFTHHLDKNVTISGSIQDVGFVYHTKNVESYSIKGNYSVEGLNLLFDQNNPEDYWGNLQDDFEENVILDTINEKYISFKPLKLNGAISYGFGERDNDCRYLTQEANFKNHVGLHLFSRVSSVHTFIAATLFFEKRIAKNLHSKFTYTVDPFSFSNIGFGISAKLGIINAYIVADNLLSLKNVYDAKSFGLQVGANIIITNKN
ncbi:DUF5723 family protein [Lutibacter sp.]|uniref:DUF5723 family protein n=1 Tax=Lutibacter sp. TaxID=1925666 RepID=UPI002733622B|nr:DUF5723 family protein [Lutibacter sp.]MDP3311830.1 DUF5723 family protein [Lutibacter sp.]